MDKNSIRFIMLASFGLIAMIAMIALLVFVFKSFKFDFVMATRVSAQIQNGTIPTGQNGVVHLKPEFALRTVGNNAYVTQKSDLYMVLFPTWRGRDANLTGYLYTSKPLSSLNTYLFSGENRRSISVLVGDAPSYMANTPQRVFIDRELGGNWYEVSRGED